MEEIFFIPFVSIAIILAGLTLALYRWGYSPALPVISAIFLLPVLVTLSMFLGAYFSEYFTEEFHGFSAFFWVTVNGSLPVAAILTCVIALKTPNFSRSKPVDQ
ncbi:MAG: hypothetical protein AAF999_03565 [Pseudomonadota bacterium]